MVSCTIMSHPDLKLEALRLRKKGLSYSEIKKYIPVSKSTLSLWLKSVPLSSVHKKRLYTKQILILSRGAQSQRERRKREIQNIIQLAKDDVSFPLSFDAYRLFGAALYWAEGDKTKCFEITNSDPHLILFMVRWLEKVFCIPPTILRPRLNIYPQQNEKQIKRFWSDLTHVPVLNFHKSYIKPISKGYKKNNLYYGTIKIYVPKSIDRRYKVFGWVQAVLQDIDPHVESTLKRWTLLTKGGRPVNIENTQPPVAQLAEQGTLNPKVEGSSPSGRT